MLSAEETRNETVPVSWDLGWQDGGGRGCRGVRAGPAAQQQVGGPDRERVPAAASGAGLSRRVGSRCPFLLPGISAAYPLCAKVSLSVTDAGKDRKIKKIISSCRSPLAVNLGLPALKTSTPALHSFSPYAPPTPPNSTP